VASNNRPVRLISIPDVPAERERRSDPTVSIISLAGRGQARSGFSGSSAINRPQTESNRKNRV